MSEQQMVIQFTPPNEALRKLIPRTFTNLQKAGYFPPERRLATMANGDFVTDLTSDEFAQFAAMVGARRVDRDAQP
jgi:hypothetical protein